MIPAGARRDPLGRHRGAPDRRRPGVPGRVSSTSSPCSRSGSTGSGPSATWPTRWRSVTRSTRSTMRASTPLNWGQVDDTPFGGGAGMVLRVDVMEAALRDRYGVDPVAVREDRRVIALTPADGCSTTRSLRAGGRAGADAAVRALRGVRRADPRELLPTRCRSAATCCPAASRRRWWSATPCCASCRACWGRTSRRSRSRSRRRSTARRSTRTTRARPSGAAGGCPRCCSPATTSGSASGGSEQSGGAPIAAVLRYRVGRRPRGRCLAPRSFFAMSTVIDSLERPQLRRVPDFQAGPRPGPLPGHRGHPPAHPGLRGRRDQAPGRGRRETFTVRKKSFGVGVERTFPVHSPKIERIEVAARGDVRRAKLYYLRGRVGKRARVRERRYIGPEEVVEAGLLHDPAAEAAAAADDEVPGEAVDQQALDEAEVRRGRGSSATPRAPAAEAAAAEVEAPPSGDASRAADDPKARGGEDVVGVGLAARAGPDRRGRARAGARHPGVPRQAVPHPERVDGADARDRPARARQPHRRRASAHPDVGDIVVFHPPAGAEQGNDVRRRASRRRARRATSRRPRRPT